MNTYTAYEAKIASLMIGLIEMLWAFLIIAPTESVFYQTMMDYGLGEEWFLMMLSIGCILCYGAVRPCRKARHMGLALSVFMWLSMFVVFAFAALLTPVTLAMPVFCGAALLLLVKDAAYKGQQ